jgi:predicted amidohydrolase
MVVFVLAIAVVHQADRIQRCLNGKPCLDVRDDVPKEAARIAARTQAEAKTHFADLRAGLPTEAGQSPPDRVKVAAVQMLGYDKTDALRPGFDPSETVVRYMQRAARDGARLVVFPEYLLGRITVPGPQTEKIAKAAAAHGIYAIVGCWEVCQDGSFANTALLFDPRGKIAGKYRKVHAAVDHYEGQPPWSRPPSGKDAGWFLKHDPEWAMQRGDDFPVFDLDFGRIGILTCYDGFFPETFRILSLKGAEILVWINGRGGVVEDFIVKSAMFQDEVAMICTNQAYGAGTMIGEYPARILARCPEAKEAYLTATIDLRAVRQARGCSRNVQQRRPELYGPIIKPLGQGGRLK